MRWNRLFIVCCSSVILFSFAGCKKVIQINVEPSLAPLSAIATPGKTLQWVATASGESFDVVFDSGLCTQKSPIHASYRKPAVCTIAPQTLGGEKGPTTIYTYSIEGNVDGRPFHGPKYNIMVGPARCKYCPTVGPRICPYCRPPY
jgi:hypothetical protein